jgi:hypothetical protein
MDQGGGGEHTVADFEADIGPVDGAHWRRREVHSGRYGDRNGEMAMGRGRRERREKEERERLGWR